MGFVDRSTGSGTFGANLGRVIVTNGDVTAYVSRDASLFPNYFGQPCSSFLAVERNI